MKFNGRVRDINYITHNNNNNNNVSQTIQKCDVPKKCINNLSLYHRQIKDMSQRLSSVQYGQMCHAYYDEQDLEKSLFMVKAFSRSVWSTRRLVATGLT